MTADSTLTVLAPSLPPAKKTKTPAELATDHGLPVLLGGDRSLALRVAASVIQRGGSPRTADAYARDLRLYGQWLRDNGLVWSAAGPEALDQYAHWLRSHWKLATARRRMAPVRNLYAAAYRLGFRDRVETQAPDIFRGDTREMTPGLVLDDLRALFGRMGAIVAAQEGTGRLDGLRDRAILTLLFLCGLRRQEVSDAQVADLVTRDGHAVLQVIGKGNKLRPVKLAPARLAWVLAWVEAANLDPAGPLFRPLDRAGHLRAPRRDRDGRPRGPEALGGAAIRLIVLRRLAQAGLTPLTARAGRVTFITQALRGGAPLYAVQAAAGHADPRTTARYADLAELLDDWPGDHIRV
jgi:site-specific recombinase XerD